MHLHLWVLPPSLPRLIQSVLGERGRRPEWVQAELWDEERGESRAQTFLLRLSSGERWEESHLTVLPSLSPQAGPPLLTAPLPPPPTLTRTFLDSYLPRGH